MTVIGFRLSGMLRIALQLFVIALCLISLPSSQKTISSVLAQNACPPIPTGGGSGKEVWLSTSQTGGTIIQDGSSYRPANAATVYIHASAWANGSCQTQFPVVVPQSGIECVDLEKYTYFISAIGTSYRYSAIGSPNTTLNSTGVILGTACPGTTRNYPQLSSVNTCQSGSLTASTGPRVLGIAPLQPGIYVVGAHGTMTPTPCNFNTDTGYANTTIYNSAEIENGCPSCTEGGTAATNSSNGGSTTNGTTTLVAANLGSSNGASTSVGEPVSVINGNMYLDQTDFELTGLGAGLRVTRAYNSLSSRIGLFGESWTSNLEAQALPAGPDHFYLRWGDQYCEHFFVVNHKQTQQLNFSVSNFSKVSLRVDFDLIRQRHLCCS